MNDLERLVAIEDIKQLKARYYRFLDTKQWDDFETVFTEDAVMDVRNPDRIVETDEGLYRGNRVIRQFAERALGNGTSTDRAFLPEITVTSATEASGIWAQEDRLTWPPGNVNTALEGFGYEYETYEKIGDAWRIKSTRLTRVVVKITRAEKE